jgi:carbon storage regulator
MLALSRKEGQTIYIDGNIEITVTSIRGNRVTLGIDAPRECHIRRGELPAQPATESSSRERLKKTISMPVFESLGDQVPCCG